MAPRKNIMDDLNSMIVKVAADKAAKTASALKVASPGDGTPDGTKAPETGAQMASNKAEAAKGTAAKVDGGAETNKVNESVVNSTEGATAVDTKGQSGAKGGDLAVKHQAANGASSIQGDDKKTASAKLAEELRAAAVKYDQPQTNADKNAIPAAKPDATKAIDAGKEKAVTGKVANAADPFRTFLSKIAADMGMPAGDPAAAGAPPAPAGAQAPGSDQVIEELLKKIQSGEMTEEQAEKILNEAMKAGAIDPKMMAEAMDALHASGAPGDPAASATGAPPAGPGAAAAPAAPMPDMGAGAPPAGPEAGAGDPMAAAKLAMAEVGPEDSRYLAKLASIFTAEHEAGYAFGMKVAEALIKAADEMPTGDGLPPKADEPGAPKGPEAGAGHADPMVDPAAAVKPEGEHEMAALKQLLDEMGIKPEELAELLKQHHAASAAPAAPAPTDPAEAKIAAFKKTARTAIVKMAVDLQIAADAAKK